MRKLLIAGNWKMNTTGQSATELASGLAEFVGNDESVHVLVCPPFPYIPRVVGAVENSKIEVGAQNCYFEEPGAFTGEIAIEMLQDIGCSAVILGHSERRHVLGETDEIINKKVKASLAKKLAVILCVGELIGERESGKTNDVLNEQLAGGLADVSEEELGMIVIAYEPVWAIGTGLTASPEQANEAHAYIRNWVAEKYSAAAAEKLIIQYGGSVKPGNAKELLSQPDVDGALVGGASLTVENFSGIIAAGREVTAAGK